LITIISVIQEGIAYQLVNHSSTYYSNNSKSYTNNTNYYYCKGVPIKPKKPTIKKRSNSFSFGSGSSYTRKLDDDNEEGQTYIIKENEGNPQVINEFNSSLKKNKLSRSYSSSKLYSKTTSSQYTNEFNPKIKSKTNTKVHNGSNLKYCISQDFQNSSQNSDDIDNTLKEQQSATTNNKPNDMASGSHSPIINLSNPSKVIQDNDSIESECSFEAPRKNKISIFILIKNLLNLLDIFKNLNHSSSTNNHQKPIKPFNSVKALDDKEKWKEFNRIYNETMYNLKAEEYYKSKSQIFKYSTGLNSVQSCYFDLEDNSDDMDTSAINSMSILDEKIREKSESQMTDILSRIKKDTLTFAEIKECGEYMRRVGIYQLFIQCPINHFLRILASKLFSCGEKKYSPILRFLFVTCVISPIQISINILCLALSNKKTPSDIKKCFSNNFSHILKLSLVYVPFSTQYLARTFLPRHLWVPFFNLSSFILGTYIKIIMKKKDDRKLINF